MLSTGKKKQVTSSGGGFCCLLAVSLAIWLWFAVAHCAPSKERFSATRAFTKLGHPSMQQFRKVQHTLNFQVRIYETLQYSYWLWV